MKLCIAFFTAYGLLLAQPQQQTADLPIFRVSVTARTAKAVSYQNRSGATKIDFRGTELLPGARGAAKVESKQGRIGIEAEFTGLRPATKNGAEYLTYVLWAITPEGRTANLGEILLNGGKSKLNVTTELQVFGLVVTAEPYFAVTQPSDLIVMENVVRADTRGKIEEIDAKYELLQRGQYQRLANPLALKLDRKLPLELYEARNAVQIARAMGASQFATETFEKAGKSLAQAEAYQSRKAGSRPVTMTAREAVQTAEDSRAIAVKRQEEGVLTAERLRLAERTARTENALVAAESETDRIRRNAESARISAQADADRLLRDRNTQAAAASLEADRLKKENDTLTATAKSEAERLLQERNTQMATASLEADRLKKENESLTASAKAEADRFRMQNEEQKARAEAEADRLLRERNAQAAATRLEADRLKKENDALAASAKSEAERLRMENEEQKAGAQAALAEAAKQKALLETEKTELRAQLMTQFNLILQTRDTARGLIVNMSDVLFDTGKFSLRSGAREKLAKVAGIVSGHPGLRLDVEGYTDSVGGDDYNQHLSEQRGEAVRDYLTKQGMAASSVTAKGFGKAQPVATNETAEGRQQNRRVELVISGDVIGTGTGLQ